MKNLYHYLLNIFQGLENPLGVEDVVKEIYSKEEPNKVIGYKIPWRFAHLVDRAEIATILSTCNEARISEPKSYAPDFQESQLENKDYTPSIEIWFKKDDSAPNNADDFANPNAHLSE
mgnify:CR=1 FL=1|tara:strand:+ start:16583 stop:16936 length:354 start_codon:yes stop_codon:yes gene_type:complete